MNKMSVLIMSCDAYEDTWEPFFKLYTKYFPNEYKTYICTETKECKHANTIKATGSWTKRLRKALEQIDTELVLFMLDDFFIHGPVNKARIDEAISLFDIHSNTAVFNFEKKHRENEIIRWPYLWERQYKRQFYLNSCQPSIHNRSKLIERLQQDQNPWEWELTIFDSPYDFYINSGDLIIDIGYYAFNPFGIVRGKWSQETKELFDREGIKVDYEKRGFIN